MNTKIIIKKMFLAALAVTGRLFCVGKPCAGKRHSWRVLRYHSVSDARRHETNVRVDDFRRQMEYLKSSHRVISVKDAVEMIRKGTAFEDDCVSVTFDDGYMDNYINAYPVLKDNNIPAAIFLISDYIGGERVLLHDQKDGAEANRLLRWEQIREMDPRIIDIGSHTSTHFRLSRFDRESVRSEIVGSKEKIEANAARAISMISYPFGQRSDFSAEWEGELRKAGFVCGFLATYGLNGPGSDLFKLNRIGIEASDTLFTLKAKLDGSIDPFLMLAETPFVTRLKRIINRLLGVVDYS